MVIVILQGDETRQDPVTTRTSSYTSSVLWIIACRTKQAIEFLTRFWELANRLADHRAVSRADAACPQGGLFAHGVVRLRPVPVVGPAQAAQAGLLGDERIPDEQDAGGGVKNEIWPGVWPAASTTCSPPMTGGTRPSARISSTWPGLS